MIDVQYEKEMLWPCVCTYFSKASAAVIGGLDGTELILKCWRRRKMILGMIFSATHIKSGDGSGGGTRR